MDFWKGVLASIIATISFSLAVQLYRGSRGYLGIRKTIRLINDCNNSGIVNVFSSRQSYLKQKEHGTAANYISQTNSCLYYIGFWLASSTEVGTVLNKIETLIYESKKVYIVFIDPTFTPLLDQLSIYLGLSSVEITSRVEYALNKLIILKKGLSEKYSGNLIIKSHRVPLSTSAFIIDPEDKKKCKILIDYKIYGCSRDDSYGIEFKGRDKIITSKVINSYINICDNADEYHYPLNQKNP